MPVVRSIDEWTRLKLARVEVETVTVGRQAPRRLPSHLCGVALLQLVEQRLGLD
jgi:hypothetical protein